MLTTRTTAGKLALFVLPLLLITTLALSALSTLGSAQFGDSLPDLVIKAIVITPEEPEAEEVISITAVIENQGRERVVLPFNVSFQIGEEFLGTVQVLDRLGPRETTEVSRLWTAVEGEHPLIVRVDPFDNIKESNERNNRRQLTVVVKPPQGVRSLTLSLFEAVAEGLKQAGEALHVQTNSDLFQLFEETKSASLVAQQAFTRGAQQLTALAQALPPILQDEPQIQTGSFIAERYDSIAEAFGQAGEGIQRLNLQLLIRAFESMRDDLAELATITIEGVSLAGLEGSVTLMDQALEEARQLEQAATGETDVDVEAVAQKFLSVLAEIGTHWIRVAEDVVQSGQAKIARFTNAHNDPILRYKPPEELLISVPDAQRVRFELFDKSGTVVLTQNTQGNQLRWKGTDSNGATLPPGPYFYRLTAVEAAGHTRTELGRLVISE